MTSLYKCAKMNATAVVHLQNNRIEESIKVIKEALNELQTFVGISAFELRPTSPVLAELRSVSVMTSEENEDLERECPSLFAFFQRAFILQCECPEDFVFSRVLIVLVYNLALATQIRFVRSGKMDQSHLLQVIALYQNGLDLQEQYFSPEDHVMMLPVHLALVNNQGCAFSQGQWFCETRERLRMLICLLHLFTRGCAQVDVDDYEIFFASACVFLDGGDLCLAPAA